jgi:dTDP-4-amino-4,6-dideoxygalactose transaminase
MINYNKHYIDNQDIKAVTKVLKSSFLTQGPQVNAFEKSLCSFFGSKYCLVTSNGTTALHLAGIALGWKKNDIIIASPLTFVATTNSILYSGAKVELVDIDKDFYTMDVKKLEYKIKNLKQKKLKVHTVIVTDYAGQPADWVSLKKLSMKFSFKLVNDNCHAIGSKYLNTYKYAVRYADIVTHSYHPVKNITTGEGGAVLTNNFGIYEKVKFLRSHFIKKDKKKNWYYSIVDLGYNYRMTDFQAALGISQLRKLKKFVLKNFYIAKQYNSAFSKVLGLTVPKIRKKSFHSFHLYPLKINFDFFNIKKDYFLKKLKKKNINLQVHYIPIHFHDLYKKKINYRLNNSEAFYKQIVSLPVFYSLKNYQIKYIIKSILDLLVSNKIKIKN